MLLNIKHIWLEKIAVFVNGASLSCIHHCLLVSCFCFLFVFSCLFLSGHTLSSLRNMLINKTSSARLTISDIWICFWNYLSNSTKMTTNTDFQTEGLSDVCLGCSDGSLRAHKLILSTCSDYFLVSNFCTYSENPPRNTPPNLHRKLLKL